VFEEGALSACVELVEALWFPMPIILKGELYKCVEVAVSVGVSVVLTVVLRGFCSWLVTRAETLKLAVPLLAVEEALSDPVSGGCSEDISPWIVWIDGVNEDVTVSAATELPAGSVVVGHADDTVNSELFLVVLKLAVGLPKELAKDNAEEGTTALIDWILAAGLDCEVDSDGREVLSAPLSHSPSIRLLTAPSISVTWFMLGLSESVWWPGKTVGTVCDRSVAGMCGDVDMGVVGNDVLASPFGIVLNDPMAVDVAGSAGVSIKLEENVDAIKLARLDVVAFWLIDELMIGERLPEDGGALDELATATMSPVLSSVVRLCDVVDDESAELEIAVCARDWLVRIWFEVDAIDSESFISSAPTDDALDEDSLATDPKEEGKLGDESLREDVISAGSTVVDDLLGWEAVDEDALDENPFDAGVSDRNVLDNLSVDEELAKDEDVLVVVGRAEEGVEETPQDDVSLMTWILCQSPLWSVQL